MKADLMKILAGMGLSKDTIADCDRFFEGEIRLEQVRELTVIELHKQPEAVQAGVRSGFQALLLSDRQAVGRFLRLFHKICGVTLLFGLYQGESSFRKEFNELIHHEFLHPDMVRWIAQLASMCQLRYLRLYAAAFLERIFRDNPEILHVAANNCSPAGQIYLVSFMVLRDPVKYVEHIDWLDKSIVTVAMEYLFQECKLTGPEKDLIRKFISDPETVSVKALEDGLKPGVRKRIYKDIARFVLNGLYYSCKMVEAHSKVAKRFIQLIALVEFSLTLELSDVINEERGFFWAKDGRIHTMSNGKEVVLEADFESFEALGMYFARDRSSAFAMGFKLEGADPGSFEVIDEYDSQFARDQSSVWFYGRKIEGADPKTFEVLGGHHCHWAKDSRRAYCFHGPNAAPKIINTKSPDKFDLVQDSYWEEHAKDEQFVYYYGRRMKNAKPASFRSVPCERFGGKELGCGYFTDDVRIYHKGREVVEADLASFLVYWLPGGGHAPYGVDKNNAYYNGKPLPPEQGIDILKTARKHSQFQEKIGNGAIRRMEEWNRTGKRPDEKSKSAAGEIDFSGFKVLIQEWGEFHIDRTEDEAKKAVYTLEDYKLKRRSSRIPAARGVTFGFSHVSTGATKPTIHYLTIRLLHPPIRNPETGLTTEKTEWDIPVGRNTPSNNSYTFDEEWEIAEGRWVFQVVHGERALAEKAFEVVKPGELDIMVEEPAAGRELLSPVRCLAVSSDGRYMVSGSEDALVKIWNLETGRVIKALQGHIGKVEAVTISPDGRQVLSGGDDGSARLWDLVSGRELRIFRGHKKGVTAVAFSRDGKRALTAGEDWTVRLWDVANGKELKKFWRHLAVDAVAFSPDEKSILSGGYHMKLWDVDGGKLDRDIKFKMDGGVNIVTSFSYTGDGRRLLIGNTALYMLLWDLESGKAAAVFPGHTHDVTSVAISPDGGRYLSGGLDGTIRLWDAKSTEEILTISGLSSGIHSIHFLPGGNRALSGGLDGTIRFWDLETGKELSRLNNLNGVKQSLGRQP